MLEKGSLLLLNSSPVAHHIRGEGFQDLATTLVRKGVESQPGVWIFDRKHLGQCFGNHCPTWRVGKAIIGNEWTLTALPQP